MVDLEKIVGALLYLVLLKGIVCIMAILIIDQVLKMKKEKSQGVMELYKTQNMGEAVISFMGVIYVPVIFLAYQWYKEYVILTIFIFVCISIMLILLLVRAFMEISKPCANAM